MNINLFNILMILGSIQGFIISALLIFNPQYSKKSNTFLSLLVFIISVQNISNSLIDIGYSQVEYWPLSWTLLIPYALRYFVIHLTNSTYEMRPRDYLLLIPFGVQIVFKLGVFIIYLFSENWVLNRNEIIEILMVSFELAAVVWCFFTAVQLIQKLAKYQKRLIQNFSSLEGKSLSWLKNTLTATLIICGLWAFTFSFHVYIQELSYLSYLNWISIALITYWLAYSIIARRNIFEAPNFDTDESDQPKKLPLKSEEHFQKIIQLMEDEYLFRVDQLSMDMLAEKLGLSNGYVSQIINHKVGKNFFEFVNEYRVKDVMEKIKNSGFAHYSLLGIAMDSGFTSKSTFNTVFKKIAGMTPSSYQKQIKSTD